MKNFLFKGDLWYADTIQPILMYMYLIYQVAIKRIQIIHSGRATINSTNASSVTTESAPLYAHARNWHFQTCGLKWNVLASFPGSILSGVFYLAREGALSLISRDQTAPRQLISARGHISPGYPRMWHTWPRPQAPPSQWHMCTVLNTKTQNTQVTCSSTCARLASCGTNEWHQAALAWSENI